MIKPVPDVVVVLDIGGTTMRAARMSGTRVDRVVSCHTPTMCMSPETAADEIQKQLVDLSVDLVRSVARDAREEMGGLMRVGVSIAAQVAPDRRTVTSAPDIWGYVEDAFPLAARIETALGVHMDLPPECEVRICSDVFASASGWSRLRASGDQRFALLMVRTGLSYVVGDKTSLGSTVLLGHMALPGAIEQYECTCGGFDHFTSQVSGAGIVNVLINAALKHPKAFRASELFRYAAQRYERLRFDQRLALFRRHAVLRNTQSSIDPDVWRSMFDQHAEITPGEQQRWVLPALLDAGMFIEAVDRKDAFALDLLEAVTTPVALYLERYVLDDVDVIALSGGFARALGEAYRSRIAPSRAPLNIQWAVNNDLDDLRNTRALLWPAERELIIDLRDSTFVTPPAIVPGEVTKVGAESS